VTRGVALAAAVVAAAAATALAAVDPEAVPLGDGRISSAPKAGHVFSCRTIVAGAGGAHAAGPWIDEAAGTWNRAAKLSVRGAVKWPQARYATRVAGSKRTFTFNNLPVGHATGTFPIAGSDPASAYDRNPNAIAAQSVRWSVPSNCLLSRASRNAATLVGYALDGFGVYVVKDAAGNLPANAALDACHGRTAVVPWNGKPRRIYHYVATLEYPYSVGCFHGTPIASGRGGGPPGGGPPMPGMGGP
jgi:hypothetical protein